MRRVKGWAALGPVFLFVFVLLAAGCRGSTSPTTNLEDVPVAGSPSAYSWGGSSTLEGLSERPPDTLRPAPPEPLPPDEESMPLPSRFMAPGQGRQTTIDRVVGRVNKDIITLSEVQELAQPLIARLPKRMPRERREEEIRKIQNMVLDRIIDNRLQIQQAERLGVAVSDKELDEAVSSVMARNNLTPEQFDALLEREGLTMDQYREKIKDQILRRRVYRFEIISQVQVSDADVRDYYEDHLDKFVPPKAVALSQIFVALPVDGDELARRAARQKTDLILAALKQGEPFAEVARLQSEDPTAQRGGKLGRFAPGEMLPALEKVAFEMREGEIRGPIKTDRGLHFIKVDRRWGDRPMPLEKVANKVRAFLLAKKRKERYRRWLERLRGDAFIERVDLSKKLAAGG